MHTIIKTTINYHYCLIRVEVKKNVIEGSNVDYGKHN